MLRKSTKTVFLSIFIDRSSPFFVKLIQRLLSFVQKHRINLTKMGRHPRVMT
jgi:hypothetical protein